MQDLKDLKKCFHAGDRGGQAPALRARKVFLSMHRSGSGDPELQFSAPNRDNRDNLVNPAQILPNFFNLQF